MKIRAYVSTSAARPFPSTGRIYSEKVCYSLKEVSQFHQHMIREGGAGVVAWGSEVLLEYAHEE